MDNDVSVSSTKEKPRVCFYCLSCYPLFNPEYNYSFGGWETRISLISKELAKRNNFDITIVVADYGQPHIEYRDGVRLISWIGVVGWSSPVEKKAVTQTSQPKANLKRSLALAQSWFLKQNFSIQTKAVVIFLVKNSFIITYDLLAGYFSALKVIVKNPIRAMGYFRDALQEAAYLSKNIYDVLDQDKSFFIWRKDIEMFDEAQADIYVVPGNHGLSAAAAYYSQMRQKKYIFMAGSDYDYYPEYKTDPDKSDIYGEPYFRKTYAIEQANLHIVQTPQQANLLNQGYGCSSVVIPNPIDLNTAYSRAQKPETILWVGRFDERIKRPSLILKLARRMSGQPFVVILNKYYDNEGYSLYSNEAKSLPNLTIIERVPFDEVEKYYASARLLICTSVFEGFPNTFLQAAKYGVPIVATDVDPNGMLSQHGCGITCGGDFEQFVEGVERLLTDDDLYAKSSAAILQYVRTYHDKEIVISQYEKEFQELLTR